MRHDLGPTEITPRARDRVARGARARLRCDGRRWEERNGRLLPDRRSPLLRRERAEEADCLRGPRGERGGELRPLLDTRGLPPRPQHQPRRLRRRGGLRWPEAVDRLQDHRSTPFAGAANATDRRRASPPCAGHVCAARPLEPLPRSEGRAASARSVRPVAVADGSREGHLHLRQVCCSAGEVARYGPQEGDARRACSARVRKSCPRPADEPSHRSAP